MPNQTRLLTTKNKNKKHGEERRTESPPASEESHGAAVITFSYAQKSGTKNFELPRMLLPLAPLALRLFLLRRRKIHLEVDHPKNRIRFSSVIGSRLSRVLLPLLPISTQMIARPQEKDRDDAEPQKD